MLKTTSSKEKREIIVFSVTVIIMSSLVCYVSYKSNNPNISFLSVFVPSALALALTAIASGGKGVFELFVQQTIRKTALKWFLVSLIGIPIVASLAMLTSLQFDISRFHLRTTQLLPEVIVIVLIAIGEEYGWRGYLLPRLMKNLNVFHSSLLLGFIWGLWHFPAYLIGTGVPQEMEFLVFLVWVILGTLFISWIYYYTRNVLTAIFVHISANAAFNYLPILPEFSGSMDAFWGLVLYLTILILVVYYFGRKDLMKA
ncbi:CPBP family intramembrane glutamic endopeptidase [Ulvibacterium sp.]|uniref:CPBP family intramembrane glutamic endopeptidase n=1 Tax=Ulvibacterium sp. TaxID=2665914 RepID=UPI0026263656|nr:CPBP family intramembrane glutamic endopeptidase [Ulvibacterium sp.]